MRLEADLELIMVKVPCALGAKKAERREQAASFGVISTLMPYYLYGPGCVDGLVVRAIGQRVDDQTLWWTCSSRGVVLSCEFLLRWDRKKLLATRALGAVVDPGRISVDL